MKADGALGSDLGAVAVRARRLEELGFVAGFTFETDHDPFLPLAVAAQATERLRLHTAIAVAFARNPMTLAMVAHDLQRASAGRFSLGVGSQIKPHIERRFSMPWSHPAPRMRELILAVRAIWRCWDEGASLRFAGEFYRHTLMTPFFNPGPSGFPPPPILLAAVGETMTEVAGEVADGVILHGFTTERYIREVSLPALVRGRERAGRSADAVEVLLPAFVVLGDTEAARARSADAVRAQIAFYGSTPGYRPVLELHGWGDLGDRLNTLSTQGRWEEMPGIVDDTVLNTFAVVGDAPAVARGLLERYGDIVGRVAVGSPVDGGVEEFAPVVAALREAAPAS